MFSDGKPSEMGSKDDEKLTKRAKKQLKEKRWDSLCKAIFI